MIQTIIEITTNEINLELERCEVVTIKGIKRNLKSIKRNTEAGKKRNELLNQLHAMAWEKYGNRCKAQLKCDGARAIDIHEIVPRSFGKRAYTLENMLPVCRDCHAEIHRMGPRKFQWGYEDSRKSLKVGEV